MAKIYAGTAYNQVITLNPHDKRKQKSVIGALSREAIIQVAHNHSINTTFYASSKAITTADSEGSSELWRTYGKEKVIYLDVGCSGAGLVTYALSNGQLYQAKAARNQNGQLQFKKMYNGEAHNLYTGAVMNQSESKCLFYGKGVVPCIIDLQYGTVAWKGKNVKHDQLDLEVPIHDVGAYFFDKDKSVAILNYDNKLRIYDVRGTHRRPVKDIQIKVAPRSKMTKMIHDMHEQHFSYIGNDVGQVYQLDSRKQWQITAKYKGITTSITGLSVGCGQLYVSSLDCNVRVFNIEDRELLNKFYLNKAITSLYVDYSGIFRNQVKVQEQPLHYEEEQNLEEQFEENTKKKVKFIRKRNKVGLKYLQPQQFDTPEQAEIKEEEEAIKKEQWYCELNPVDRLQFQQE